MPGMMTPAKYLEEADHFAKAAEQASDKVTKSQLEALATSYSVLAQSTAVLNQSARALKTMEQRRKK
ncbi:MULTISPECIES: hypothetical protein [unclassified Bradyrhizobium]